MKDAWYILHTFAATFYLFQFSEREAQHFEAYNGSAKKDGNIKNTWERIAKMMESGSKSVRGTKDTTRMKSLVLSMSKENENGAEWKKVQNESLI